MAVTSFGTNDEATQKKWSRLADAVALPKTSLGRAAGKGQNNIVCIKDELAKGAGDVSYHFLRDLLTQDGRTEGQTLEGNEERLTYNRDSITINQIRFAVRWEVENISDQRVAFNTRQDALNGLGELSRDFYDTVYFNHLCGNTVVNDLSNPLTKNGMNTVVQYDTNHTVYAGSATNDQGLTSSDTFDLGLIDEAIEKAKTLPIPLRPVNFGGQDLYVCYLHPYQVTSLRNTSSQWYTEMRNAMQGGLIDKNPIFTGALGVYNGVVFVENTRVTTGVHSSNNTAETNVRRAVLAGAQSCMMSHGRFGSQGWDGKIKWVEKNFDYDEEVGVAIKFLMGLKRCIFKDETYGSIVIPTYAAAA